MTATLTPPADSGSLVGRRSMTWEWALDRQWPLSLAALVILIGGWELSARFDRIPDYLLSPSGAVDGLHRAYTDGLLMPALELSGYRLAVGFLIGTTAGVVLGLVSGMSRTVGSLLDPMISIANPLPKIALLPVFAVWMGFTDLTRISIIALGCFFPTYLNAASGTRLVEVSFLRVSRNVEASRLKSFFHVVLPAALPRVLVGVRISLALSFVVLFASEIVVSPDGVGGMLYAGFLNGDYSLMYAGLLVLAVAGFVADLTLAFLARRLTRGQSMEVVGRG